MLPVLKNLVSSKKFMIMAATILMALASKLGLNIDPEMLTQIIAVVSAYLVGQGIADHGKEAAKINAAWTGGLALPIQAPATVPAVLATPVETPVAPVA